jgi:hypothetical protein
MCRNWAGGGCVCDVMDLEPDLVCDHGNEPDLCGICEGAE